MSTIFTLRPSEQQIKDVEKLKTYLGVGHASKALLFSARRLPELEEENDGLKSENFRLESKYKELIDALNYKNHYQSKIDDITKL